MTMPRVVETAKDNKFKDGNGRDIPASSAKKNKTAAKRHYAAHGIQSHADLQIAKEGVKRLLCGAKLRNKNRTCRRPAGAGTNHLGTGYCHLHTGNTPAGEKQAQQQLVEQRMQLEGEMYGRRRDIGPHEGLLEEVQRTAGHVEWLERFIHGLNESSLVQDSIKDGRKADAWHAMYMEERKHFVNVCATAIKMGIAERAIELAEDQGKIVARIIISLINDDSIALTPAQRMAAMEKARSLLLGVGAMKEQALPVLQSTGDGSFIDVEGTEHVPTIVPEAT